jgi:hypothetical protein
MGNELIRPIDPESARAIEETAKATSAAIGAVVKSGEYAGAVAGDLPHNLVGLIGDWVYHKRLRRWNELQKETREILRGRGIEDKVEPSPSVAIPLIDAAIDEDREGLKQLWAKLLAAAMDPQRADLVRPSLIMLLKQLDPLDARVLELRAPNEIVGNGDLADRLTAALNVDRDQAFYSLEHLHELGCMEDPTRLPMPPLSAKARLLMRAVRD